MRWGKNRSILCFIATVGCAFAGSAEGGEWLITPSANVSETYTDNARGSAGQRESDLFTTTEGALSVRGTGARVNLDFDYSFARDTYIDNSDLDATRQDFDGFGEVELWEDHLFFDARASLSTENLTRLGANAAGDRILNSNQAQVLSYSAGPTFRRRYASWADSEIAYRFSGTTFMETSLDETDGAGAPNDNTSHQVTTALRSGPRFSRLLWELTSVQSVKSRGDEGTAKRRTSEISSEYRINRFVSARLGLGHEDIEEPDLADDISGVTWRVGSRLTPGPRTELTVDYEHRFDDYVWTVDGSYILGPAAILTISYEEDVQTEQDQIDNALQGLTVNEFGVIVGPDGFPVNPNSLLFDLVDQTSRVRTAKVGLRGTVRRNSYSAQFTVQTREFDSSGGGSRSGEEQIARISASYSRDLDPRTTFRASADVSETLETVTPGTGDTTMSATLSITKRFPSDLFGDIRYQFLRQDPETGSATLENAATVRLRKEF